MSITERTRTQVVVGGGGLAGLMLSLLLHGAGIDTVVLGTHTVADQHGVTRERQDAYAAASHQKAAEAWAGGFYDDLVVPVAGGDLARDEGNRDGASAESLAGLRPAFRPDGTITAGVAWSQVGAVEPNEALAVQSLVCVDAGLSRGLSAPEVVNAHGAIAIGHPLSASGARVVGTLVARMREHKVRWGVAVICVGVGRGLAVVLENSEVQL